MTLGSVLATRQEATECALSGVLCPCETSNLAAFIVTSYEGGGGRHWIHALVAADIGRRHGIHALVG